MPMFVHLSKDRAPRLPTRQWLVDLPQPNQQLMLLLNRDGPELLGRPVVQDCGWYSPVGRQIGGHGPGNTEGGVSPTATKSLKPVGQADEGVGGPCRQCQDCVAVVMEVDDQPGALEKKTNIKWPLACSAYVRNVTLAIFLTG